MLLDKSAIDLILSYEGMDQPSRWPKFASGITLGHGYDLGYCKADEFERDWSRHLSAADIARLKTAIGIKGAAAGAIASKFRGIVITKAAAAEVFARATLPKFIGLTQTAFHGSEWFPPAAFGALVSLVFNRGASMTKPSLDKRREMRAIRDCIAKWMATSPTTREATMRPVLLTIAAQIRSMKRLWPARADSDRDLTDRREAEAKLIESAAKS
jgi:GH24 family phage-related lysozyme (muramidase)